MNPTLYAIEKNRVTIVVLLLILGGGILTYLGLPRAEDPGFIIRTAVVTTRFPGASPERVEQLVTDKIEKAVQEMPELDSVNSTSRTGLSVVYVNIKEEYKVMRPIWDKLRRKVDSIKGDLPAGITGPDVNDEFGDVYGQIVTITGEGYSYAELKQVADDVRDELLRIKDAAKVEILGAQEERVFVEYNNARLAEIGLSPTQLSLILESTNIINPGGEISTPGERIVLEPSGNFESVDQLKRTLIQVPGSADVIFLEDICQVYRGYIDPPASKMRASGEPCLGLAVSMRDGGNIVSFGQAVRTGIDRLRGVYPIGLEFDFVAFQPETVKKKVNEFIGNLGQAVGIVMLVMLITLGFRTGLVVSTLVPMTIFMTFIFMGVFEIGLDQVSLAALIIALGLMVDNAIVMSESVMVRMQAGEPARDSAVASAKELMVPLLISSLTTCAAFSPFYLAKSSMGEYVGGLFIVVTITLLCSWALSITMIPMFCVRFLKAGKKASGDAFDSRFYQIYRKFVIGSLRYKILTVLLTGVVFFLAVMGLGKVPAIFMPPSDTPVMTAELRLPIGTPIERTEAIIAELDEYIKNELTAKDGGEGVLNWASFVGESSPRFVLVYNPQSPASEFGMLLINATSRRVMDEKLVPGIENYILDHFPDVSPKVKPLPTGAAADYPVEIRVSGKESDKVFALVDEVRQKLTSLPEIKLVTDNWGIRSKKILVNISQPRVRRAGLTSQEVAMSLKSNLTGIETTEYREKDKIIPVVLRSIPKERKDLGILESLNVFSGATGASVPLKQVADIEVVWQPSKILRRDRLKTVTVQADIRPGASAMSVTNEMNQWLEKKSGAWEIGYRYAIGGEFEESAKANQSLMDQLPLAGCIIIFLLVFQFNSLRRPVIILITIPLGMIGVTIGLLTMRSYFGFMTFLGVISLAGIVINNAIVLLDRIKIEIEENGFEPRRAIVEAAQKRLRPILLTTVTTVGGLIPLYVSGGPMWEPMAVAIIFGILFATVLTLCVVPVLYSILFRVDFRGYAYLKE